MIRRIWKRISAEPRPLRFLFGIFLKRSGMGRLFTVRRNGYVLRVYPTSLSAAYWINPDERLEDEEVLAEILRPGDAFIDVGANIGALTLRAAAIVGVQGHVYSFEPHPRVCKYLRKNVKLNAARQVEVFCFALGSSAGVLEFSNKRADDMNQIVAQGGLNVPVKRLDDILAKSGQPIALLKIDAEDYELPVLEGAIGLLARVRAIYFEAWEQQYRVFDYGTAEVLAFLARMKFAPYRRVSGKWTTLPAGYVSAHCENLLALALNAAAKT